MEIIFNEKPGQIFDLFHALYFAYNRNADDALRKYGIEWNKDARKAYEFLLKGMEEKPRGMDFFFKDGETAFFMFYSAKTFWQAETIPEFIKPLSSMGDAELKALLAGYLSGEEGCGCDGAGAAEVPASNEELVRFIEGLDRPDSMKWNSFSFFLNPGGAMGELIRFISAFADRYAQILRKNVDAFARFNSLLEAELTEKGEGFFRETFDEIHDTSGYKRIFVSTAFVCNFTVTLENHNDGDLYLFLGKNYREVLEHIGGKNEEEHALTALKIISDPTRYQILSLLNGSTFYGQELADRLQLSLATISHHMEQLHVAARVVKVELSGNKAYYTLNREALAKCIRFVKNRFGLDI